LGKITRPILPEVYPRKRLFEALDKLRRQPVVWISGPGGCGKTRPRGRSVRNKEIRLTAA